MSDLEIGMQQEGYQKETNGSECPCDANAACNTPAAERVWTNFISPALLLLAMCIHGVFEGLVLGIQVRCPPSTCLSLAAKNIGLSVARLLSVTLS